MILSDFTHKASHRFQYMFGNDFRVLDRMDQLDNCRDHLPRPINYRRNRNESVLVAWG